MAGKLDTLAWFRGASRPSGVPVGGRVPPLLPRFITGARASRSLNGARWDWSSPTRRRSRHRTWYSRPEARFPPMAPPKGSVRRRDWKRTLTSGPCDRKSPRGITSIEVSARRPDGGTEVLLFARNIPTDWPTTLHSQRTVAPSRRHPVAVDLLLRQRSRYAAAGRCPVDSQPISSDPGPIPDSDEKSGNGRHIAATWIRKTWSQFFRFRRLSAIARRPTSLRRV